MIYRVSEAIAIGPAIAKGLELDDIATLGFMFRWRKFKGRRLDSWPARHPTDFKTDGTGYISLAHSRK